MHGQNHIKFQIGFANVAYTRNKYLNLKLPKSWNVPSKAVQVSRSYHSILKLSLASIRSYVWNKN